MRMAGIDPGSSASAALVVDGMVEDAIDVATFEDEIGKRIEVVALARILERWSLRAVTIERAWAMPSRPDKDGKSENMAAQRSFSFGAAFGDLRTTVRLCGLKTVFVAPLTWKNHFKIRGVKGEAKHDLKERSRQFALQAHPEAEPWLKRKKDHGRAEAILIADYGVAQLVKQDREAGEIAAQPGLFGDGRA